MCARVRARVCIGVGACLPACALSYAYALRGILHFQDKCRRVSCQNDRAWVFGQPYCTDTAANTNSSISLYNFYLTFQAVTNATRSYCLQNWSAVKNTIIAHLTSTIRKLNSTISAIKVVDFKNKPESSVFGVWFITGKSGDQIEFELKIIEFFTSSRLSLEIPNDGNIVQFQTGLEPNVTYMSGSTFVCLINSSHCDLVDESFNIFSYFFEKISFDDSPQSLSVVDFNRFTPYAKVKLDDTEFEQDANSMITLTYVNVSIDARKVHNTAEGLSVPIIYLLEAYSAAGLTPNLTQEVRVRRTRSDTAKEVLSLCCLVVSIASLIFLLTTYCAFSELRTLPGINNMFLAAWLLVAQVLLLSVPARTEIPAVCRVLGVMLHYAWLCVVSWSSACSFHMFHVFVTQRDRMYAPHRQQWYVKRYALYSHTVPAVIVALVLGSTAGRSGGVEIGYGGHVCYLNTALLRGVAFVLPLLLAVSFNLVQLALTARELSRAQHVQSYGGQAEPGNVCIYAKLSSLTGLCWVVALVAEVPGCGWLGYVSAVLNGLQGLHLSVSYTINRRVMRLWRQKVTCAGTDSKTRHSTTSSSSARYHSGQTISSAV